MSYQRPYNKTTSQDNASQRKWEPESFDLSYKTRETIDEVFHYRTYCYGNSGFYRVIHGRPNMA